MEFKTFPNPNYFIPKFHIKQEYRDVQKYSRVWICPPLHQHLCRKCVRQLYPSILQVEAAADCVLSLLKEGVSSRLEPHLFIQPSLLIMRLD